MSKKFFTPLAVCLLAAIAPLSLRADTPLEEQMDKMKRAFRGLRTALEAPVEADKEKYAGMAEDLRAAADSAKQYEPEKTETVPQAKRAAFLEDYRQSMDKLVAQIDELKKQLAAGQWDAAQKQIKLINQSQRQGHKEFRVEKD